MIGVDNPHRIEVRCDVNDFPSPGEVAALFPPGAVTVPWGRFLNRTLIQAARHSARATTVYRMIGPS
jgi:hypothetical protein